MAQTSTFKFPRTVIVVSGLGSEVLGKFQREKVKSRQICLGPLIQRLLLLTARCTFPSCSHNVTGCRRPLSPHFQIQIRKSLGLSFFQLNSSFSNCNRQYREMFCAVYRRQVSKGQRNMFFLLWMSFSFFCLGRLEQIRFSVNVEFFTNSDAGRQSELWARRESLHNDVILHLWFKYYCCIC